MEIINVEKLDVTNIPDYKINIKHNGMNAFYFLSDSLKTEFFEEIKKFKKFFFDMGEEDWQGVTSEDEALDFFDNCHFLYNEEHIERKNYIMKKR